MRKLFDRLFTRLRGSSTQDPASSSQDDDADTGMAWDTFKPISRLIYSYYVYDRDAQGNRKLDAQGRPLMRRVTADPMELYKRFMDEAQGIDYDLKFANEGKKIGEQTPQKAHDRALTNIRKIFQLDEKDLPQVEVMRLLNHFVGFVETIKKNSSLYPTSPNSSADSAPISDATPSTSKSSESGSTDNASTTAAPTPSVTGSELPSASSSPACPTTGP